MPEAKIPTTFFEKYLSKADDDDNDLSNWFRVVVGLITCGLLFAIILPLFLVVGILPPIRKAKKRKTRRSRFWRPESDNEQSSSWILKAGAM